MTATIQTDATAPVAPRALRPMYFGQGDARLFGVFHPAQGKARGALLMCPPLLHELMRSHRFFSLLAERFAEAGFACLRFDYHGTGDSGGSDADFSPAAAVDEIVVAADALRRCAGINGPLVLLGIRASALFATRAAHAARADAVWWWLPVAVGRAYIDALDMRYREELASSNRYPMRNGPALVEPHDLLGFHVSPDFRNELSQFTLDRFGTLDAQAILPPVTIVDAPAASPVGPADAARHTLSLASAKWADEIDLNSLIALRDVETIIQALSASVPYATPNGVAHG